MWRRDEPVRRLTTGAVVLVVVLAGLLVPGRAGATIFGVADNHPRYAADGGAYFFSLLDDLGFTADRVTLLWNADAPAAIPDAEGMDRMLPQAATHGIEIMVGLYPARAKSLDERPDAPAQFAAWAAKVARRFPQVHRFVIGNEFNQPRFLQPQFRPDCTRASGAAYLKLLSLSYDALKAVNPAITVVTSVSSRGNDNCRASSNVSTSPYRFIYDMGAAYRAMGRTSPAWDEWGIHAYPNSPTDPLERGFRWPNIGLPNFGRLRQALWDAFATTPQPTFGSLRFGTGLGALGQPKITVPETGWQTAVPQSSRGAYFGRETDQTTSDATQADIYAQIVRTVPCDPDVRELLFFGLYDEPDLARLQTGLIRADGTRKPSYDAVKRALAETRGRCQSASASWTPTTSVVGAHVDFDGLRPRWWKERYWALTVGAEEEATYRAGVFRVPGPRLGDARSAALWRAAAGSGGWKPVLARDGCIKEYWSPLVRFDARRLRPGYYVYAVQVAATMNPARTTTFTSKPFRVLPRPRPVPPRRGRYHASKRGVAQPG